MEFVSIPKLRRYSVKLSLCKECKVTTARHAQSLSRTQTLRKNMFQGVHIYEIRLSIEVAL
jgi:hypothetical protein